MIGRQNPDGTWTDAVPLPMTPGVDFEVYADVWMMFDGYESIKSGHARTRIGRAVAMWRAKRAYLRGAR